MCRIGKHLTLIVNKTPGTTLLTSKLRNDNSRCFHVSNCHEFHHIECGMNTNARNSYVKLSSKGRCDCDRTLVRYISTIAVEPYQY